MMISKIRSNTSFHSEKNSLKIKTIDMHTGGEPLRIVMEGYPDIKASSLLEFRRILKEKYDHLRTAIMHEPRGHADMYGCLLLSPFNLKADFSVIFMHNEGYSTMCGHAIIALTTLAVKMKWVEVIHGEAHLTIEAPCGLIQAKAIVINDQIQASFLCVPSFVIGLDYIVEVPNYGKVVYDLAYGGAFYTYVDSHQIGLELSEGNYKRIIESGMAIKHAVMASNKSIAHPFESDLSFLYGTIFIGGPVSKGIDSRNVCVFADGEVDRSPTGSGVSGRMAIHYKRKELALHQKMKIESITGAVFIGSVESALKYGDLEAVIPCVEGTAYVTGQHEFILDPEDPFTNGFFLR
jgi:proline racemase